VSQDTQKPSVFARKTVLPDDSITKRSRTLLGFDERYAKVHNRLSLLLRLSELPKWSKSHHQNVIPICELISEQYPLVVFHGDVGTGKTVTAEGIANNLVAEAGDTADESILFKLSTRVRGSGKVGEMGTLLSEAFSEVIRSAGKNRRAILIIDEGDSLAAKRTQEHSHHEDKVAVNTLIQHIDDLLPYHGRILVFLCTNRVGILDAALMRRAALVESFKRPTDDERRQLFERDLAGLSFDNEAFTALVDATRSKNGTARCWTFSDMRTRLYPAALAKAFPNRPLVLRDFLEAAAGIEPSPTMEDE
jgi:SpoVK/Ycf46/Vps4 family AAA+-type ATPase